MCRSLKKTFVRASYTSQIICRLLYLQNDFGRFRLTHSPIAVVGSAGVHAYCIIIGCVYEQGAF